MKQPYGGYIHPRKMVVTYLSGSAPAPLDHTVENVHSSLAGMAVDYLTRWSLDHKGAPHLPVAERIFSWACGGASMVDRRFGTDHASRAAELCELIDNSRAFNPDAPTLPTPAAIAAAVELSSFDGVARSGFQAYSPDANTTPDAITVEHIATMVERSLSFFERYGPPAVEGFTVSGGDIMGDGDFVTLDTLWDFKVSAKPPASLHTLQLIVYWIMAKRSDWNWTPTWNATHTLSEADWRDTWDFDAYLREKRSWPEEMRGPAPTHIGIYNPRLDAVYRLAVAGIPAETIEAVSRDVIRYVD